MRFYAIWVILLAMACAAAALSPANPADIGTFRTGFRGLGGKGLGA